MVMYTLLESLGEKMHYRFFSANVSFQLSLIAQGFLFIVQTPPKIWLHVRCIMASFGSKVRPFFSYDCHSLWNALKNKFQMRCNFLLFINEKCNWAESNCVAKFVKLGIEQNFLAFSILCRKQTTNGRVEINRCWMRCQSFFVERASISGNRLLHFNSLTASPSEIKGRVVE